MNSTVQQLTTDSKTNPSNDSEGKPNPEQLAYVYNTLRTALPKLFVEIMDYKIYENDMIFENNIKGTRTVGLYNYMKQISVLRTIGHIRFAYVRLDILKITQNPEDSSVKVRWRIRGLSGLKVIVLFWKYKLWKIKEIFEKSDS